MGGLRRGRAGDRTRTRRVAQDHHRDLGGPARSSWRASRASACRPAASVRDPSDRHGAGGDRGLDLRRERHRADAILSQVVLSLQLPFTVVRLVRFTTDRKLMGELVAPRWVVVLAWTATAIIIGLNMRLLFDVATAA